MLHKSFELHPGMLPQLQSRPFLTLRAAHTHQVTAPTATRSSSTFHSPYAADSEVNRGRTLAGLWTSSDKLSFAPQSRLKKLKIQFHAASWAGEDEGTRRLPQSTWSTLSLTSYNPSKTTQECLAYRSNSVLFRLSWMYGHLSWSLPTPARLACSYPRLTSRLSKRQGCLFWRHRGENSAWSCRWEMFLGEFGIFTSLLASWHPTENRAWLL